MLVLVMIHFNCKALKILTLAELEGKKTQLVLEFGRMINKKMVHSKITPQWYNSRSHPMHTF